MADELTKLAVDLSKPEGDPDREKIVPLSPAELRQREADELNYRDNIAPARLRRQRDNLLKASDYTQLPDFPIENRARWATYRQELRDLPATTTDPANPVWPESPA